MRTNEGGQPIGERIDAWTARPLPPRTPMVGRACRVERLDPAAHADALHDAFGHDPTGSGWTYLFDGPFADRAAFDAWLEGCAKGTDPLFHAIVELDSGRAVGVASFMRIDPGNGCIEVGNIHFSPLLQRTTLATETMYLMMRRVFDELGYRRYEWKCDSLNAPSRRAAERFGFSHEGLFRQALVYKGRNRDTTWYSVVDREWPAIRDAYEAWLDPANFDAAGGQRRSLGELTKAAPASSRRRASGGREGG